MRSPGEIWEGRRLCLAELRGSRAAVERWLRACGAIPQARWTKATALVVVEDGAGAEVRSRVEVIEVTALQRALLAALTPSAQARLARLRALLDAGRGSAWDAACGLLDLWRDRPGWKRAIHLLNAEASIAEGLRRAPEEWILRVLDGRTEPRLRVVRVVEWGRGGLRLEEIERLAACRDLGGVAALHLERGAIGPAGLGALVSTPNLRGLRELWVRANRVGDEGVAALVRSSRLRQLRVLDLGDNRLSIAGAGAIAGAEGLASLAALDVSDNAIGLEGARLLLRSPHLRGLERLSLSLADEAIVALAGDPALANLDRLEFLEFNRTGGGAYGLAPPVVAALRASPYVTARVRARVLAEPVA